MSRLTKKVFPDGGFVLHGVTGSWLGRCSAWYDKDGRLLDAEQRLPSGKVRPVIKHGPAWGQLQLQGHRCKGAKEF